jgi:O-antigen/teichoic acid export membrane protein
MARDTAADPSCDGRALHSERGRPGIATHYLRYLGTNAMVVAAGFISFPLLARLLENRQFGLLGYYEAWGLLLAAVLKLGTQHAILRFYPHGGDAGARARFRARHVLWPFALTLALWLACLGALVWLWPRLPAEERPLLAVVLLGLPLTVWSSLVEAVMYALERSDISLWLKTAWRWSELLVVLGLLLWVERSALGVMAGKFIVLLAVALWLTRWFRRWSAGAGAAPGALRAGPAGLAFALPMMCTELSSLAFGFADRILLRAMGVGLHDLGVYTIGYGLAMAVGVLVGATLNQAFTPTALRLYAEGGADAVRGLKQRLLEPWLAVVAVACALLLAGGRELLALLAGADKAGSGPVFVIVATSLVVYSLFEVAQYGMLLQRRAVRFLLISLGATVFNLLLNVPLIQQFGVLGAAWATALSYAMLAWLQYRHCPPELRYLPRPMALLAAIAFPCATSALLIAVDWFGAERALPRLAVGCAVVLAPALVLLWSQPRWRQRWRELLPRRTADAA